MNDNLTTGGSGDTLVGWLGDDTYVVGSGNTNIVERAGDGVDTVQAWVSYTLAPNVENLTLMQGGLTGTGNELANRMVGSSGSDVLNGVGGNHWVSGGAGNDIFAHTIGGGHDTIADFHVFTSSTAEYDKLMLKGHDASAYLTHVDDEWTVHYAAGTDSFRSVGVTQLSSSDYAFVIKVACCGRSTRLMVQLSRSLPGLAQIGPVGQLDAVRERGGGAPSEFCEPADVEQFARRAVRP